METIFIIVVSFLLLLAVFDLFVGVSNDAVNFLNSAVGARVARWRVLLIVASAGVLLGAMTSAGMMDLARHGIMLPSNFSFREVMTVFLAVMVTDVIVLDRFNSLGLPTSTTVSLVFELFGAATLLAFVKVSSGGAFAYADLINTDKCLSVIVAIFVSVGIAFVCGLAVQWLSRLVFTFRRSSAGGAAVALFGGVAFTALVYFIFIKGLGKSAYVSSDVRGWVEANSRVLLLCVFAFAAVVSRLLAAVRVDVFKVVVLVGTFALAMAFAGNDLVNFIGVPLAGLASFQDWSAAGCPDIDTFMMSSLMGSAASPAFFLFVAGVVMVLSLFLSRKARKVVDTEVGLSRQDEGDEMFGSSRAARSIVRAVEGVRMRMGGFVPRSLRVFVARRFDNRVVEKPDGAAYDVVRAAVNLVVASILIVVGTNYKLPLSTTYVTFMVAMGSSLADKAWGRETAVFRITGVLSVIGGWFITACVAFVAAAVVCALMYYAGFVAMFVFMAVAVFVVVRSNFAGKSKPQAEEVAVGVSTSDLRGRVVANDAHAILVSKDLLCNIVDGFFGRRVRVLRRVADSIKGERRECEAARRREMRDFSDMSRSGAGAEMAEAGLWLQLGADCRGQYLHALRRMSEPILDHVDNGFNPATHDIVDEFAPLRRDVVDLFAKAAEMIAGGDYMNYEALRLKSASLKRALKAKRHERMDKLQHDFDYRYFKVSMVYIGLLRETQALVNILRHHMEAAKCLNAPAGVTSEEREALEEGDY